MAIPTPSEQRAAQLKINAATAKHVFKKEPTPVLNCNRARSEQLRAQYLAAEFALGRRKGGVAK